ncbi:phytoene desaturase [Afifella sp. IM 167]|uniref:phytoene desaturase n=1 Tax=Afifella sp. IM 167 TaxID=2033586 RepID=UPI001CCF294D|nr:phytoene desaturase [Afifella sp. IM 167]MBZ8132195.1 phytoene dehydrogenase [Afifella sp. IM 167]
MLTRASSNVPVTAEAEHQPHAIVIGSGFGGLAAAIRLGARGYRVTILEKLDKPGGRAYVFRQDGFTFDSGPTIITAPFLLEELWALCGRSLSDDIELRPLRPFYRLRFDRGEIFECSDDPEAMRREVARFSPDDVAGYERFMAEAEKIYKVGFEDLAHVPFGSLMDMARVLPDFVRLQSFRTVYGCVARYVKDERLRTALSFHPLFIGGNPFAITSIYAMIAHLERKWGVHFVMGGTGRLAEAMVGLVEGQGGYVRYNACVEEILVEDGRAKGVRLAGGETLRSDIVVSNADSAWTYRHLIPAAARKRWTDRKIDKARYSMGLFVWYFGTDRRYEDVAHHTILFGPRYRSLVNDIFRKKKLAEDFSLYLHRPTATDPSLAPEGCDAFYVLSPVPHLDSATDWAVEAEPYRRKIEAFLAETTLPGLGEHVVSSRVATPVDFRERLLAFKGAAFGLEPLFTQSAWFRPHNKSEDVEGLYLVGAGTHPGAGVPGVLSSAKVLDMVVPDAAALA